MHYVPLLCTLCMRVGIWPCNFQFVSQLFQKFSGSFVFGCRKIVLIHPHVLQNSKGPTGKRPYTRVYGATPVVSFTNSHNANKIIPIYWCHERGYCCATFDIMALIIPILRSTLLVSGCQGVHQIGEQPTLFKNSRVNSAVKLPALSLITLVGKPVNCHSDNIASQQLLAVKFRTATAWGNLEAVSYTHLTLPTIYSV